MKKLILASQSPRRRQLLEQIGIEFECIVSEVSEDTRITEPDKVVEELATRKADAVFRLHPESIILGADTVVALDGQVFGKPQNTEEAFEMLRKLSDRSHQVYTGCALIYADEEGKQVVCKHVEKTDVYIGELSDREISSYIATGEPMDKAGSYAIQGKFAGHIRKIDGDYYNVVGLPLYYVSHALKEIRD